MNGQPREKNEKRRASPEMRAEKGKKRDCACVYVL